MRITFFSEKSGSRIGIGDLSAVVPQSCTVMMKVPCECAGFILDKVVEPSNSESKSIIDI
jgi:hypothetical protein